MFLLGCNRNYVLHFLYTTHSGSAVSVEFCDSSGTNVIYHLAADGASLTGGQVTVVAVGQVDADFACSLHLELVHSLTR